jgi:hypothetical protein
MSCSARFDLDQCGTSASCTRHENTNGGATVINVAPIWCLKIEILRSNRFPVSAGEAACVRAALQTRLNSDPVADGLNNLSVAVAGPFMPAGAPMPSFVVRCDGAARTCTCEGACTGITGYNDAAMNTIVFGRGSSSCSDATSLYYAGMCDIFPRITAANVVIVYAQTGLGYVGRPNGPVPTISITLQNLPFQFYFLGGLMGLSKINIPAVASIGGEDLSSGAPL